MAALIFDLLGLQVEAIEWAKTLDYLGLPLTLEFLKCLGYVS